MATLNRTRPSELLGIGDPYTAWCIDEVCLYMVYMAHEKKKEPDFGRLDQQMQRREEGTTNEAALCALAALGIKAKKGIA